MLIVPNEEFALSRKPHSFRLRKSHVLFPINKGIGPFSCRLPSLSDSFVDFLKMYLKSLVQKIYYSWKLRMIQRVGARPEIGTH
jgi:hypothetical protein